MGYEKILGNLGVKTITTNDSIKIYGNPNLNLKFDKKIVIKKFFKRSQSFYDKYSCSFNFWWKLVHTR